MEAAGRYIEAAKARFGEAHSEYAVALNLRAELNYSAGRYAEAEPFYERALASHEAALGPAHPDTLVMIFSLAKLYSKRCSSTPADGA